ncbi:MAG TPA: GTPase [Jatrophihabitans sp.]|jgi:energy-coupling factor transporter ATP-binding protein EcfA2|nr:GTPase [Jatrophihabitans sp.]
MSRPAQGQHAPLLAALRELRSVTAELPLNLQTPGAAEARTQRDQLVSQLDDYLIPRLEQQDAPLLVVIGGSTGAGKSTLVNALVGHQVSQAGVLRPTTRSPVLVFHPDDAGWFTGDRILPGLARTTGPEIAGDQPGKSLRLVAAPSLTPGLALLDAPDVDSFVETNRELAVQLLAAADLWLFVTTAARYADAVPWDLLRVARERATALAVVLDRVPPEALGEVESHLRQLLDREGLGDAPLLVVPEATLDSGRLPDSAVAPVRNWIGALAADAESRAEVIRATLTGAVNSLQLRGAALASAVDAQEQAARELSQEVDGSYDQARATVGHELSGGTLLRGEVLARWQEFVGTGELMRTLESRIGWVRDRVVSAVMGRPSGAAPIEQALESSLEGLLRDAAERAAASTAAAWSVRPDGRALLAGSRTDLARAAPDFAGRAEETVRVWQGEVLELVRAEGGDRRQLAKLASYGVNGAGSVLIVALFAQTGGLTGGEIAIAGGTAALSQKVLEAIFGDQAVRSLASRARDALLRHVDELLAADADRFRDLLAEGSPPAGATARFRAAVHAVEVARAAR